MILLKCHKYNTDAYFKEHLCDIKITFGIRFGIYFKIFPEAIVVLAVLHTSRNPQIWKNR